MKLYLIRHPKPDVEEGVCYGSSNIPASLSAEADAVRHLSSILPKGLTIYTSPLSRCARLASCMAAELNSKQPIVDPRLMELHFGTWEMQSWNSIARDEIEAWSHNMLAYRPGGGEPVLAAAGRVREFFEDIRKYPCSEAIIVCHAGTIRLLLACIKHRSLTEIALAAAGAPHRIGYGEMIIADC